MRRDDQLIAVLDLTERDLADALKNNEIAAAGLDVLCVEPMSADNPLREIKDSNKLIIASYRMGEC